MAPDKGVGIIVLTNETNVGFPDAIGLWTLDRVLDNPKVDYVANTLKAAKTRFETAANLFAKRTNPRPFPSLAPLAGNFVNPSFGEVAVAPEGATLVMKIQATGAKLELSPGTAMFSRSGLCRAIDFQQSQKISVRSRRIRPISDRQGRQA